jgi:formylglycine-generating enzyme required for sulfatase activity
MVQNIEVPFRWCPAGVFLMGSPNLEKDRDHTDENQSQVTLTKGFWIMETEVTQELYQAVIGSNPSHFQGDNNLDRLPVENVSWEDADAFCKKTNQQLGGNFRITLPTEAQWEYACRAGRTTATAFGDYLISTQANFNGNYQTGNAETDKFIMKTTPVASYLSNLWGLYDMHGNVSELCADWYEVKLQGGIDPVGPENTKFRVFRGGGWDNTASYCRSARRGTIYPTSYDKNRGFRLALTSTESKDK